MKRRNAPALKFGTFAVVMLLLSVVLVLVFGQYRTGSTVGYSAIFTDSSGLRSGDTVRVAGVRVGTVHKVSLRDDHHVRVNFDADRGVALTSGSRVAVRYLDLVGNRYLDLTEGPGPLRRPGSEIPIEQTDPALDLDVLLGGLKPVVQGLNAKDVNTFTWSLLQIMQGKSGTVDSLLARTASFTQALAGNSQVIQQLIDNLKTVMVTLSQQGGQFGDTIDKLQQLVDQLAQHRDPIGDAITALDHGTATIADLLTQARPPLADDVAQLNRLAPPLDQDKDKVEAALQKAPDNFRKLVRIGAYGNWVQYYLCEITVRIDDPTGQVVVLPAIKQDAGRCSS